MKQLAVSLLALGILIGGFGSVSAAATGLTGQWHLDTDTGDDAEDDSAFNNDGDVFGAEDVDGGKFDDAFRFDGNDYVRVRNQSQYNSANVTVEAWVKRSGTPGINRYIVSKGANNCYAASYGLYTGPNGGMTFYIYDGITGIYPSAAATPAQVWD